MSTRVGTGGDSEQQNLNGGVTKRRKPLGSIHHGRVDRLAS